MKLLLMTFIYNRIVTINENIPETIVKIQNIFVSFIQKIGILIPKKK